MRLRAADTEGGEVLHPPHDAGGPMRFVIPLPPNRANQRGAWRKLVRQKQDYMQKLDNIQLARSWDGFEIPGPPDAPLTKALVTATLHVWSPMDDDNAMARLKFPMDWLVRRGYLRDDTRKVLTWAAVPGQVVDRKHPRIVIELREAA